MTVYRVTHSKSDAVRYGGANHDFSFLEDALAKCNEYNEWRAAHLLQSRPAKVFQVTIEEVRNQHSGLLRKIRDRVAAVFI